MGKPPFHNYLEERPGNAFLRVTRGKMAQRDAERGSGGQLRGGSFGAARWRVIRGNYL